MRNEWAVPYSLEDIEGGPLFEGAEKRVYKIFEDGNPYALKIFKSQIPGNDNVNRDFEAKREYDDHVLLQRTALADLVPKVKRLAKTRLGYAFGLVVEWRDGISLETLGPVLRPSQIADLEQKILSTIQFGVQANVDMYSEGNLMVDGSSLWIAECRLIPLRHDDVNLYRQNVLNKMQFLKNNYMSI